jgi:hypothetical protein
MKIYFFKYSEYFFNSIYLKFYHQNLGIKTPKKSESTTLLFSKKQECIVITVKSNAKRLIF